MHRLVPVGPARPATPAFSERSRVLLVAPHPDDESLACGVILQAAVRAGAAIRVVYATDGENNPWPQRFIERKWRIKRADRLRWGKLRQREAEAALITLGLRAEDARFLGLPDQGLTDRLMRDPASMLSSFARLIEDFAPTDMFLPSIADAHPDHNALAVTLLLSLRQLAPGTRLESAWQFVVHGKNPVFFAHAGPIEGTRSEIATKVRAIKCHQTQLRLSRKRFLGYAQRPERFLALHRATLPAPAATLQIVARNERHLTLLLPPQRKLFPKKLSLLAIGHDSRGALRSAVIGLSPKARTNEILNGVTGVRESRARLEGDHLTGMTIVLPAAALFSLEHPIFLKLSRPSVSFADAGWCEVPAFVRPTRPADTGYRETALHESLQGV